MVYWYNAKYRKGSTTNCVTKLWWKFKRNSTLLFESLRWVHLSSKFFDYLPKHLGDHMTVSSSNSLLASVSIHNEALFFILDRSMTYRCLLVQVYSCQIFTQGSVICHRSKVAKHFLEKTRSNCCGALKKLICTKLWLMDMMITEVLTKNEGNRIPGI